LKSFGSEKKSGLKRRASFPTFRADQGELSWGSPSKDTKKFWVRNKTLKKPFHFKHQANEEVGRIGGGSSSLSFQKKKQSTSKGKARAQQKRVSEKREHSRGIVGPGQKKGLEKN